MDHPKSELVQYSSPYCIQIIHYSDSWFLLLTRQGNIQIVCYHNHLNTEHLNTGFIWIPDSMGAGYSKGKVTWLGGPIKYQTFWTTNRLFSVWFWFDYRIILQPDTNLPIVCRTKSTQSATLRLFFITDIAAVFTSILQDRYFLFIPPRFAHTAHSPSLRLPSRSNPHPIFSKCTRNDVTPVRPR